MTNYEKLCEATGIKPLLKRADFCKEGFSAGRHCDKPLACINCPSGIFEKYYLRFTAEKQIELIKLISKENFVSNYVPKKEYWVLMTNDYASHNNDFSEALAGLTLNLIEAGELDKDEIRRILEL